MAVFSCIIAQSDSSSSGDITTEIYVISLEPKETSRNGKDEEGYSKSRESPSRRLWLLSVVA